MQSLAANAQAAAAAQAAAVAGLPGSHQAPPRSNRHFVNICLIRLFFNHNFF